MLTFIYVSIFQHKRVCKIYKERLTYARDYIWERATNVHEIQRKLPTQKDFRGRVCGVNIVGKNRTNCNTWQAPLTGTTRACRQVPSSARERASQRERRWEDGGVARDVAKPLLQGQAPAQRKCQHLQKP